MQLKLETRPVRWHQHRKLSEPDGKSNLPKSRSFLFLHNAAFPFCSPTDAAWRRPHKPGKEKNNNKLKWEFSPKHHGQKLTKSQYIDGKKSKWQDNVPRVHSTVKLQQGCRWTHIMSCWEMNAPLPFFYLSLLSYLVKYGHLLAFTKTHSYALPPHKTWPTRRWAGWHLHRPSWVSAGPAPLLCHNPASSPVQWSRKEQISVLQRRQDEQTETERQFQSTNWFSMNACSYRFKERRRFNRSHINRFSCFTFDCLNLG